MNSKQKGDIALAKAIAYYIEAGYEVLLPIGDKRPYDLVIEDEGGNLKKVQCKYTSHKTKHGVFTVPLRVMGGNRSFYTAKLYDKKDFDILFACTAEGSIYSIPFVDIKSTTSLNLGKECNKFKINGELVC